MGKTEDAIGHYRLLRLLGEGGQGRVFLAERDGDGRTLALKVAKRAQRDIQAALRREIEVLSELAGGQVPGAVELVDHGENNGLLWLAMEYVDGPSLDRVLSVCGEVTQPPSDTVPVADLSAVAVPPGGAKRDRISALMPSREQLLPVVRDLAATLAALHARGLVHGDVKPQNLLIPDDGPPVLIDFGNARRIFLEQPDQAAPFDALPVVGTQKYMAPEHHRGRLDPRTDVYSLGCVLFEVLYGTPFQGTFRGQPLQDSYGWPDSETLELLHSWLEKLLERDADRRLSRLDDWVADMDRHLGSQFPRVAQPRVDWAPFVGRQAELAQLDGVLSHVRAGESAVVGICGGAGSGKTRLLNEMAAKAAAAGCVVDNQLTAALLSDAWPRANDGVLPPSAPRLVVFDHLEQHSTALRGNLRALAPTDLPPSTLLLLAWRSSQAFVPPRTSLTLSLGGLSRDATMRLSRALLGGPAAVELVDRLIAKTGGSPARVWQLLDLWVRSGAVSRVAPTEPFRASAKVTAFPLGAKVARVQEARVSALSERHRRVLHLACVVGPQFRLQELKWIACDYGPDELVDGVAALVARDLLLDRGQNVFRLQDPALSESAAWGDSELDAEQYRVLATAYEQGASAEQVDEPRVIATQARLYSRAAQHAHAAERMLRAGRAAQAHRDRFQARIWYRQAIEEARLCEGEARDALRPSLLQCQMALADLLTRAGDHGAAEHLLSESQANAPDDVARARLLRMRGRNYQEARRYEEAEQAFEAVPKLLAGCADELLELVVARFWHHYFSRRKVEVLPELVAELQRSATTDVSVGLRCSIHQCLAAWHLMGSGYGASREAVHHAREAFGLLEAHPELDDRRGTALFYLGFPLLWGGEHEEDLIEAAQCLQAAVDECDDLQERFVVSRAKLYHAVAKRRLGLVEETGRLAREALAVAEEVGSPALRGAALACLCWVAFREGDVAGADNLSEQACAQWQQGQLLYPFQWLLCFPRSELQRLSGQHERARSTLLRLLASDQHRLPDELRLGVESLQSADGSGLKSALQQVARLAARSGYL